VLSIFVVVYVCLGLFGAIYLYLSFFATASSSTSSFATSASFSTSSLILSVSVIPVPSLHFFCYGRPYDKSVTLVPTKEIPIIVLNSENIVSYPMKSSYTRNYI
jgi:hypothetical protein